jgi:hypothetical protein
MLKPYVEVPVMFDGDRVEFTARDGKVVRGILNSTRGKAWKVVGDDGMIWRVQPQMLRACAAPAEGRAWAKGDRVGWTSPKRGEMVGTVVNNRSGLARISGDDGFVYRIPTASLLQSRTAAPKYEGPVFLPGSRVKFQHKGKWVHGTVRAVLEGNRVSLDADDGFSRWRTPMAGLQDASGDPRQEPPKLVEANSLDEIMVRSPRLWNIATGEPGEPPEVPNKGGGAT